MARADDGIAFTDRVRKAMALAARAAALVGEGAVTPVHVLAALLTMERTVAAGMLRTLGVDVEVVLTHLPPVRTPKAARIRVDHISYASATQTVVDRAWRSARDLGAGHVGTEHLLLALLEAGGLNVTEALAAAGARPLTLRRLILRQVGAPAGRLEDARLYVLLTESLASKGLLETAEALIAGGVDMIQYREKEMADGPFLANARLLRLMTRESGILFIINDRVDVAALVDADGVHVGQTDLPVAQARRLLGPTRIIGVSSHNDAEARSALAQEPDYLAVGSMFQTTTKAQPELGGIGYLKHVLEDIKPDCPVYPIGGIRLENIPEILAAGADRVAVCSAVIAQADIEGACRRIKERLAEPGAGGG